MEGNTKHTGHRPYPSRVFYQGIFLFGAITLFVLAGIFRSAMAKSSDLNIPARVTAARLNVRKAPSTKGKILTVSKKNVVLEQGKSVTILSQTANDAGEQWYYISFDWKGKTKKGYVMASYVSLRLGQPQKASIDYTKGNKGVSFYTSKKMSKSVKDSKGKNVVLKTGQNITIYREAASGSIKLYYIKCKINKINYKGYIDASFVKLKAYDGIKTGTVIDGPLNVRQGVGTENEVVLYKEKRVQLSVGSKVTILGSKKAANGDKWYQVTFNYKSGSETVKLSGYVIGSCVKLDDSGASESKKPSESEEPSASENPTEKPTEKPTESPSTEPTEGPTQEPSAAPSTSPQTEEEFTASLKKFPESYREALKQLHKFYPYWRFEVYDTGLDWEEVIKNESKIGRNLIPVGKGCGWLSFEPGAYDWATDTHKVFDGSTWVACSEKALRYYMDPRNFLTTDGIFQFENLAYSENVQNISGVRAILAGTILENGEYTYVDADGKQTTTTYPKTFMAAAKRSGVSPYHLASRVKQEVVVSTGLSNSVSGTMPGFEGIYNFYNIGANDSAIKGQNIINGLTFASTGNNLSQADKDKYLIPWNNPYNAIVGGAKYIGSTYINRGQNTIYLQKFNVTSYSRYIHQYMTNVEAAKAEGQKMYTAYRGMESEQVTFNIPVYSNMPEAPEEVPPLAYNPNNWLKSLSVLDVSGTELTMTPGFNVNDPEGTVYKLYVKKKVTSVTVNAAAVSGLATVKNTGTYELNEGTNKITIKVTSQSGSVRKYVIEVVRSS